MQGTVLIKQYIDGGDSSLFPCGFIPPIDGFVKFSNV